MIEKLQSSEIGRKLTRLYEALSDRDQQAAKILGVVACLAFIYLVVWLPTWNYYQDSRKERDTAGKRLTT